MSLIHYKRDSDTTSAILMQWTEERINFPT
jgi:hypothetical protein